MPERLTPLARQLRQDATIAERRVWNMLRERPFGFKFRRQHPIEGFIADFACYDVKLIIEVDGSQHADNEADNERTKALEAAGWTVIRLWNNEVFEAPEGVFEVILEALRTLKHVQHPLTPRADALFPLPQGRGGDAAPFKFKSLPPFLLEENAPKLYAPRTQK